MYLIKMRVLVTGSRDWNDEIILREALLKTVGLVPPVLVSGGCPTGADKMAEILWRELHGKVERHPADWKTYGRRAGFVRNAEMVNSGADICFAFIRNYSKGATMTMELAVKQNIPVMLYRNDEG